MSGFDWFSILVNIHDFRLCTPKKLVMPSARSLITFCLVNVFGSKFDMSDLVMCAN